VVEEGAVDEDDPKLSPDGAGELVSSPAFGAENKLVELPDEDSSFDLPKVNGVDTAFSFSFCWGSDATPNENEPDGLEAKSKPAAVVDVDEVLESEEANENWTFFLPSLSEVDAVLASGVDTGSFAAPTFAGRGSSQEAHLSHSSLFLTEHTGHFHWSARRAKLAPNPRDSVAGGLESTVEA